MRHTGSRPGLTLVEAMMAVALLAIAAAGLTQAFIAGQMQAYDARHTLFATLMGEELMERILAAGYDDLAAYDGYEEEAGEADMASPGAGGSELDVPERANVFSRSVTVSYTSLEVPNLGTPVQGLMIEVTLSDTSGRQWMLSRFVPEP